MQLADLSIIIPCYNESENLNELLENLHSFVDKTNVNVIIVNDGSTDNSRELLKSINSPNIQCYSNTKNRGYGNAIKTGIRKCQTKYCVTIDGDGQHDLSEIESLLNALLLHNADLVIGNRKGKGSSTFRNIGKWLIRKTAEVFLKIDIADLNSGMKLYKTNVVKSLLKWAPNDMSYSETITLLHYHFRYQVREQPINIFDRTKGKSTINYKTAIRSIKEIFFLIINFYPFRLFGTLGAAIFITGTIWSLPFILSNKGLTTGSAFMMSFGFLIITQGIILQTLTRFKFESYEHIVE
jgi:glycosyltransferase involved in cell wall biosynthesis